jgi:hypothetical protein
MLMSKAPKPFILNIAALAIVPVSAITARTAYDQIDAIYACADDPSTPRDRATALARLAAKLHAKLT